MSHRQPLINVTLSVGQSKIGAGAIDQSGKLLCLLDEIATPKAGADRYAAIVEQIVAVTEQVGLEKVGCVGVSYPELVEPPTRFVAESGELTNAPNPIRENISTRLAQALGVTIPLELLHDAAAAVLGEVSAKGTLPNCQECVFIVWGTGIASGIVHNGSLYWTDPIIGLMTGEIGLQVIRTSDGQFDYRPMQIAPEIAEDETRLDRWLRGPEIERRFREKIDQDRRGDDLLRLTDRSAKTITLIDINQAAQKQNTFAIELIESAGKGMGQALAPFIAYWLVERKMDFAKQIVIGSGVAKLGDGVQQNSEHVFIGAIRQALDKALVERGVIGYDSRSVILSAIGYEREFYAFL